MNNAMHYLQQQLLPMMKTRPLLLDEIPNPFLLKKINLKNGPVVLSMLFHYYFFNCQNVGKERWWNGTILCNGKQFRSTTPQQLRDKRNNWQCIAKGGWHFSYLGGLEKIKYKIQSFAHTEFNREEFLNDEHIIKAMEEGKDIFNRPDTIYKFVSVYYYPASAPGRLCCFIRLSCTEKQRWFYYKMVL
jgi:beta-1,4-mannosyl-glycoprotein beta-1,4-N-acetylglucosaminyltransferase